jgi:ATP-dependent DNA helicase RecQ
MPESVADPANDVLQRALEDTFGLDHFRPSQRGVIEAALAGRDVLCVMPTGAGKSLCYQLPAVVRGGLTVVVSPLIALMEDQVRQLNEKNIKALLLNSSLDAAGKRDVLQQIEEGYDGLLYVAPERFFAGDFLEILRRSDVRLFAVDEAHCISQWGHDFRTEYQQLGGVLEKLGRPPALALTATATADVRDDIVRSLGLDDPKITVTGFDRTNLAYDAETIQKKADKENRIYQFASRNPGSGIVYCSTRKNVDAVTDVLAANLPGRTVVAYHAGMDQAARSANQEAFMQTEGAIAVATNAFGMGINKPDIRWVLHYNIPGTMEAYYQEAGRAGRDGRAATCLMLYSFADKRTQEFFIDKLGENGDGDVAGLTRIEELQRRATAKLNGVINYARTRRCRRQQILDYFGDEQQIECGTCDICRGGGEVVIHDSDLEVPESATLAVRKILSAVARVQQMGTRFGLGTIAEVLTGSDNERLRRWRLDQLKTYGALGEFQAKQVIAMLHRVIETGLLRQVEPEPGRPVLELTRPGVTVMKGETPPPSPLADLLPRRRNLAIRKSGGRSAQADFDPDFTPEASARFERLRQARTDLARELEKPPYIVASNRTLQAIAVAAPTTPKELEAVAGMGPKKVEQFGEHLLAALGPSPAGDEGELTFVPDA